LEGLPSPLPVWNGAEFEEPPEPELPPPQAEIISAKLKMVTVHRNQVLVISFIPREIRAMVVLA
jgi:hypothetical protein